MLQLYFLLCGPGCGGGGSEWMVMCIHVYFDNPERLSVCGSSGSSC